MDCENGSSGELPPEIIERLLSFLSEPVLCRFRSVCKGWNELLSKSRFHDLWDLNGKNEPYLFAVLSFLNTQDDYEFVDPLFLQTTCFLDVHERRWYSIQDDEFDLNSAILHLNYGAVYAGMGDGLICELTKSPDKTQIQALVLTDPVAKSKWEILVPPMPYHPSGDRAYFPMVVTVVHRVGGGLQIFLLNNGLDTDQTQMYVYGSSAGEWRGLGIPPKELGIRKAVSAVIFHGTLYIVFTSHTLCRESYSPLCVLVSYKLEEDMWREVPVSLQTHRRTTERWFYPLIMIGDRLFLMMWANGDAGGNRSTELFAIIEILVTDNSSRVVVQIPTTCTTWYQDPTSLHQYFPGLFTSGYSVPCMDSNGICSSILWMRDAKGEVAVYDMASRSMTDIPEHPLRDIHGWGTREENISPYKTYLLYKYRWKYMNLNLRKLLSQGVVTDAQDATTGRYNPTAK